MVIDCDTLTISVNFSAFIYKIASQRFLLTHQNKLQHKLKQVECLKIPYEMVSVNKCRIINL